MKKIVILSLVVVLLLGLTVGVGRADTLTVCNAGPPTCGYGTIQAAVDAAVNGDTIKVAAGVYNENVSINVGDGVGLTISGHSANDTFVIAANPAEDVFKISYNEFTLSNFTIRGATNALKAGILIGAQFVGEPFPSFNAEKVTIQKCVVEKNSIGIAVGRTNNTTIKNNIVRHSVNKDGGDDGDGIGILIYGNDSFPLVPNTEISNNKIYDNDYYGLFVSGDWPLWTGGTSSFAGMEVVNNTFFHNGAFDLNPDPDASQFGDANMLGAAFVDATGIISVTNNKFLATEEPTPNNEIRVLGSPGVALTGNRKYPILKPAALSGAATPVVPEVIP